MSVIGGREAVGFQQCSVPGVVEAQGMCRYVNGQNQEEYESLTDLDTTLTLDLGTCGQQTVGAFAAQSCGPAARLHCMS